MSDQEVNVYDIVGGDPKFQELVDRFYAHVETDEVLRPIFPQNLEPGKHWQFMFLTQFFGGPARFNEERGHPRLRMRHAPFRIDQLARDHWLMHMLAAIDEVGIAEPARSIMRDYFERGSAFMVNSETSAENILQWQPPKKAES